MKEEKKVLIDGSRLIIESLARAGADAFVGYPITPSNLLYSYAISRFPLALPGQDEITVLQWMAGLSAAGKFPVTATSFPGLALMLESINMSFMMELPMLIILAQRLGPSSGTATKGAQGEVGLSRFLISGGFELPVFSVSSLDDCWTLPHKAMETALKLRTPVLLLTSKDMIMTLQSFDLGSLSDLSVIERSFYNKAEKYFPYRPDEKYVPAFLPLGNDTYPVRFSASTHNQAGILVDIKNEEALQNTLRLDKKVQGNVSDFTYYEYETKVEYDKKLLVIGYDTCALAIKSANRIMEANGKGFDYLIPKTLFPVPEIYHTLSKDYEKVLLVEENIAGEYAEILWGKFPPQNVYRLNLFGKNITPQTIISEIERLKNNE
jgi:2-oxoglutarate ferredoxin oxidoreductase subunit alpha